MILHGDECTKQVKFDAFVSTLANRQRARVLFDFARYWKAESRIQNSGARIKTNAASTFHSGFWILTPEFCFQASVFHL
jgi:hypothetical protein